jgi:protein SCO1
MQLENQENKIKNRKKCPVKLKLSALIGVIAVIIVSFTAYTGFLRPYRHKEPVRIDGVMLSNAIKSIPPFQLASTKGGNFTQQNLKKKWTMLFFGFSHCGMVCPATMSALNGMYKILQEKLPIASLPQVVMVTVDPERDSLTRMREYVTAFNPHFVGARADIEKTVALEKALHITAAKIEVNGEGKNHYTIAHSAEILLFNPAGELQAFFSYPHEAKQMAKDYQAILNAV